jgi:hypothetical protein
MLTRVTALALIASVALGGGIAEAATKHKVVKKAPPPVCKLVADPANDSGPLAAQSQTAGYDPSLDIVSADVASDGKNVTAVIRVKQLTAYTASAPDAGSPLGREWQFNLVINATHSYGLAAFDGPFGSNFTTGAKGGVFDYAHNEIRITQPLSALPFALPKGSVMNSLQATAYSTLQLDPAAGFGNATILSLEDTAAAKAGTKYLAGTPSCVKVGK